MQSNVSTSHQVTSTLNGDGMRPTDRGGLGQGWCDPVISQARNFARV